MPFSHVWRRQWHGPGHIEKVTCFGKTSVVKVVYFQALPQLAKRPSFFVPDVKTMFCVYDRKHSEAQRTQGIESMTWIIFSTDWICIQFSCKLNSSFRFNTLGPLCLWQCFFTTDLYFISMNNNLISSKRSCQVASLALVPILATRLRYLNWLLMWPSDGTACICCRFGRQLALLELVTSLATNWCHLDLFQCWPPAGATCIATLPSIVLLTSLACIGLLYLISQSHIDSVCK